MRVGLILLLTTALLMGCAPAANVEQDREAVLRVDREWGASAKDPEKYLSYYAADATVYPPGMPMASGTPAIRETIMAMMASTPGFSLEFAPDKADVSGDIGYTTGSYQLTTNAGMEKGKYVTIWKKQSDGQWKVKEDIFNADAAPGDGATTHLMVAPNAIAWGDAPPSLPPGGKMAVISGDPSMPGPFVIRAQVPAGYKIAPHWHPGVENLTILTGTIALGMGETWDESKMEPLSAGGYASLPAEMRHSFMARTASTFQVNGIGPFVVNYVNPADDPSKK